MIETTETEAWTCPIHGDQGNVVGVKLDIAFHTPTKAFEAKRNYCMECWVDWMDCNMHQLERVEP